MLGLSLQFRTSVIYLDTSYEYLQLLIVVEGKVLKDLWPSFRH